MRVRLFSSWIHDYGFMMNYWGRHECASYNDFIVDCLQSISLSK